MKQICKKMILVVAALLSIHIIVMADDDRPIQISQLPIKAQEFIKQYFADNNVAFAKMETDFINKNYEVFFVSGDKVEFLKNGDWDKVECRFSSFPLTIVPQQIKDYVSKNYSNNTIVMIEREDRGFEVQLNNRIELKFNKNYQLIDIDY